MNNTLFTIESYVGALPVRFGMQPDEVEAVLGEPQRKSRNFRKEMTYDYENVNVGFDMSNSVAHIGFVPGANVAYDGQPLFSQDVFHRLVRLDSEAKEVVGFVVLLKLGIAFTGFHDGDESQKAVSVFVEGAYDELSWKMKDFVMNIT